MVIRAMRYAGRLRGSALVLILSSLLCAGCGYTKTGGVQTICCPVRSDPVELTYLGSGGWIIEAGGEMLLTAPLFSNPGPVAVLTGVLEVKKEIIDERADIYDLHEALGVLVGHGHYDHLMDVSYLTVTHAKSATIYGSRTVRNQIIAYPGLDHRRIQTIDQRAATVSRMGRWTSVGTRFRFMPVRSQHSSHTENIHLWQGVRTIPMATVPRTAHDWLEGETYAYVIDVMNRSGQLQMRIYYNDSASSYPLGFPPPAMRTPDAVPMLTILTAPGHKWETDYPGQILSHLAADYALVGHWEYFFNNWGGLQFGTPTTDLNAFTDEMELRMSGPWWLPKVGAKFIFVPS